MIYHKANVRKPLIALSAFFLFVSITMPVYFGINPMSRLAAMDAFCGNGSFEITPYVGWTQDWSQTPDGRYYSNKAPAPIWLGVPVVCAFNAWTTSKQTASSPDTLIPAQYKQRYIVLGLLSLLFQVLPLIWAISRLDRLLGNWSIPVSARNWLAAALLFGNTSSLFMTSWFAHGLTGVCALWAVILIWERRPAWAGAALSIGLFSDYPFALVAFSIGCATLLFLNPRPSPKELLRFALGFTAASIPSLAYQWMCFGGPFTLSYRFQNPQFVDLKSAETQFLGIFSLPNPDALTGLLFNPHVGILFVAPWALIALAASFSRRMNRSDPAHFFSFTAIGSFLFLYFMNASFGQWHGGATSGPRYLSAAFPLLAVALSMHPRAAKASHLRWIWIATLPSLLLYVCAQTFNPLAMEPSTWGYYLEEFGKHPGQGALRIAIMGIAAFFCARWLKRQSA